MEVLKVLRNVAITMLFVSCSHSPSIEESLAQLRSRPIQMGLEEMQCVVGEAEYNDSTGTADGCFIVYVDKEECSPCRIKTLYKWEEYIGEMREKGFAIRTCVILSTEKALAESIRIAVLSQHLRIPVYLDVDGVFEKENPHIPRYAQFHTFMVNREQDVVVVGNPIDNGKVQDLVLKTLYKGTLANEWQNTEAGESVL